MSDLTPPPPPESARAPHGSPDPAAPPMQPPAADLSAPVAPPVYAPPPAPPSAPLYGEPTYPQPSVPTYGDPGYPQIPTAAYGAPLQAPGQYAYAAGAPQPIGLRPLRGIGTAARWLIAATTIATLVTMAVELWGISLLDSFASGSVGPGALQAYDSASLALAGFTGLITIAAGICWLIWQHRAASSVPPASLRRSPGWHVGSWFIPVVALWFPFQNVKDIVRGSHAPVSSGMLGGWWALWIATGAASAASARMTTAADSVPSLTAAIGVSIVGDVLWIAAAAFAWTIVSLITKTIDPRFR